MEAGKEISGQWERIEKEDVYSKTVRAGKRYYFFDVKATRLNELYLTITEAKKQYNEDGRYYFEKHRLFLFREEFDKFLEGLNNVVAFVNKHQDEFVRSESRNNDKDCHGNQYEPVNRELEEVEISSFPDINFVDLGGQR